MNTPLSAWATSEDNFPDEGTSDEKLGFILNYAILAPSPHNTQPWLFRVRGFELELYADLSRALRIADPHDRELVISCGAALYHLRLAIQYFGYAFHIDTFPDPDDPGLLARVRLGLHAETESEDILLFHAIVKRRTNRQPFLPDPIPDSTLAALIETAQSEGAWLHLVQNEDMRAAVADLVAEADRRQWSNRSFRRELAAWTHPNRSVYRDGMPGSAEGLGDWSSYAGPLLIRSFDLGKGHAAKDRDIAIHSPLLAVLGTAGDSAADWLAAGQALAKTLLRARSEEVWASFLNQPIEVEELRPRLAETIGRLDYPHILMRLGYGPDLQPTPRRPVREVLI